MKPPITEVVVSDSDHDLSRLSDDDLRATIDTAGRSAYLVDSEVIKRNLLATVAVLEAELRRRQQAPS